MTKSTRLLMMTALLVAASSMAAGATLNCVGIGDVVASLGVGTGNDCAVAGAPTTLFSNFEVSWIPSGTAIVGINSGNVSGGSVNLGFQVAAPSPTGDLLMRYQATNISGIDFVASPSGTTGSNMIVGEIACAVPFVNNACPQGQELANLFGVWFFGDSTLMLEDAFDQGLVGVVYIQKDITYNNISLSQFSNSHSIEAEAVPEPVTSSLVGLGLLGIAFASRRRLTAKK